MTTLQERNRAILAQLTELLDRLPADAYTAPLVVLHGQSVGRHVRHVAEFYECLLNGGVQAVNYDARPRNPALETDPQAARRALQRVADELRTEPTDRPLLLEDADGVQQPTSLFRELTYLVEHSVHHMAIVKIALNVAFPAIPVAEDFGVAPSTLRHRNQLAVGS
jgi:uncharacterized damage-inducible protein DinB